jgi:hypothetical protein
LNACTLAAGAALLLLCGQAGADSGMPVAGRALYQEGRLNDATPLTARRAGGLQLRGSEAACVNCHRRSGLGSAEGRSYIPPINGASLFSATAPGSGGSASGIGRPAYTLKTLARALRNGVDPVGRPLDYLMPRYHLTDRQIAALADHLRQLSPPPDSRADTLHFATIVAAGQPLQRRQAVLDVLRACFDEHNSTAVPPSRRIRHSSAMQLDTPPDWQLHVWMLHGAADSWRAQLADYARQQPVFAVVGGLGGGEWTPVHDFCEASALPCLFPHVDVPVVDAAGFYALYLSRGVLLEAALIAHDVGRNDQRPLRVVQLLRSQDDSARAAATALQQQLAVRGVATQTRTLDPTAALNADSIATAPGEARVLWLRDADLAQLSAFDPGTARTYVSATLGDAQAAALPNHWQTNTWVAYPYELPKNRRARTAQLHAWLLAHAIAPGDEALQADTWQACSALRAGMNQLGNRLQRDYLIERLEVITERSRNLSLYPRLSLGIGQRFASKSGYLLRVDALGDGSTSLAERIAP